MQGSLHLRISSQCRRSVNHIYSRVIIYLSYVSEKKSRFSSIVYVRDYHSLKLRDKNCSRPRAGTALAHLNAWGFGRCHKLSSILVRETGI